MSNDVMIQLVFEYITEHSDPTILDWILTNELSPKEKSKILMTLSRARKERVLRNLGCKSDFIQSLEKYGD